MPPILHPRVHRCPVPPSITACTFQHAPDNKTVIIILILIIMIPTLDNQIAIFVVIIIIIPTRALSTHLSSCYPQHMTSLPLHTTLMVCLVCSAGAWYTMKDARGLRSTDCVLFRNLAPGFIFTSWKAEQCQRTVDV